MNQFRKDLLATGLVLFLLAVSGHSQTTAFSFQGRLNDGNSPANGRYDLQFRLYDAITGGERVGPVVSRPDHLLINGVFSTTLAFGSAAFRRGEDRFIEISVRPAGTPNAYVVLGSRQQILSVPYAVYASNAENASTADSALTADTPRRSPLSLAGTDASGYARLNFVNKGNLQTSGNVGFGTAQPNTRLTLSGGPTWTSNAWTASMNMQNGSAIGWEANGSGQRFGIGQTNNGLHFFRTISGFGTTLTPAQYDIVITDSGDITQPVERNGLAKAMLFVDPKLPADQYIVRCYNSTTGTSSGKCGFAVTRPNLGRYFIDLGFTVTNRFLSVNATSGARNASAEIIGPQRVMVDIRTILVNPGAEADDAFYLIIF